MDAPKCKICGERHWGSACYRPPSRAELERLATPAVRMGKTAAQKMQREKSPTAERKFADIDDPGKTGLAPLMQPAAAPKTARKPAVKPKPRAKPKPDEQAKPRGRPKVTEDRKAYLAEKARVRRAKKKAAAQ